MKSSSYNVIVEVKKYDQFLTYNTLSGALLEVENDVGHLLTNYSDGNSIPDAELKKIDFERRQMLIDSGFLVDNMIDELDQVRKIDSQHFFTLRSASSGTLSLTLLPSIRCNFDCFYCFEPAVLRNAPAREGAYMNQEVQDKIYRYAEKIIDKPEVQNAQITWYGGEPLLYPEIIESLQKRFYQLVTERGKKIESSIVTNGFLLNKKNSDMLIETGIRDAQVTLDGTARIHNKRRRLYQGDKNTNFDTIIRNIKDSNPDLTIAIRINIGRHNQHEIYELLDELINYGVWPYRDHTNIYLAPLTGEKDVLKKSEFYAVQDKFRIHLVRKYNELKEPKAKLKFDLPSIQVPAYCGHIIDEKNTWLIDCAGDVYRCWDIPGQQQYRVGTVDDLLEDNIQNLEAWIMNEEIREEAGCYECRMAPVCTVSCPAHFYMDKESGAYQSGTYHGKHEDGNPFCSKWRFSIEHTLISQYEFYRESPEWVYNFPPEQNQDLLGLLQIT